MHHRAHLLLLGGLPSGLPLEGDPVQVHGRVYHALVSQHPLHLILAKLPHLHPHSPINLIPFLDQLRISTCLFPIRVEIITFVEDGGEKFGHGHFRVFVLAERVFLPLWLL